MGNGYPHSTIAQILEDIISQLSFEGESHSNIADILLSILNQTSYDKEPYSVLAELFLKLKAKIEGVPFDPYDKETHSVIADILVSILNETEYTDVPQSRIAELLLELKEELESYTEITVSGSIVSFTTNVSKPLVKLTADVEAQQDLHGYDKPWVGGGGKNKCEMSSNPIVLSSAGNIGNQTCAIPAGTYTYSWTSSATTAISLSLWNGKTQIGSFNSQGSTQGRSSLTFTISQSATHLRCYYNGATSVSNIQVESGSSMTDYAPYENICPITGWSGANVTRCGVNLWDEEWEVGAWSVVTGLPSPDNECIRSKNFIPITPLTSVFVYKNNTKYTNNIRFCFYDKNKNFIESPSSVGNSILNIPEDVYFVTWYTRTTPQTYRGDISINYPSTDTSYHPYAGDVTTIDFGDTYYGGELDVTNGVLRVTHELVDMGTLNYTYVSSYQYFYTDLTGKKAGLTNILSPIYQVTTEAFDGTQTNCSIKGNAGNTRVFICNRDYTNATQFKTDMSGVMLLYELATPFTIQLSTQQIAQLLGDNNVFADCGDVEVTYLYKGTPET